jgi:hypothetical protein
MGAGALAPPGGGVQNFPRIKNFGRLKCSKKSSFLSNHVVVMWHSGSGPSGEFGAGNSPRAGYNHPRGVRTEFDRRLARRQPPGGAAATTHVRGGRAVQGESRESGGGAGRPVRWHRTSIPAPHSCPHGRHRVAVNQDVKNQAVCSKYLPVRSVPLATPKRHGPF